MKQLPMRDADHWAMKTALILASFSAAARLFITQNGLHEVAMVADAALADLAAEHRSVRLNVEMALAFRRPAKALFQYVVQPPFRIKAWDKAMRRFDHLPKMVWQKIGVGLAAEIE